jgi:hypothetical protein
MKTTGDDTQGCHGECLAPLAAFGESLSDKVLIYKTIFQGCQGCQLSLPGTLRWHPWEPAAGNKLPPGSELGAPQAHRAGQHDRQADVADRRRRGDGMSNRSRRKGARVELAIAKLIGARKVSRAYQAAPSCAFRCMPNCAPSLTPHPAST